MPKNSVKVLAALLIWVAAGVFAYTYYKRLFPELPNRRGGAGVGRNREHPDKEIAEFVKADAPSKPVVQVKRSKAGSGTERFQTTDRNRTDIRVIKGGSVADAYAMIFGHPRWKVTQLPHDLARWDVFTRTAKPDESVTAQERRQNPGQQREQIAAEFLKSVKWDVKKGERPATRFRFRKRTESDGPAPALAEFAGIEARMSVRWKPELGQAFGLFTRGGEEPVVLQAERDVRDTKPNLAENEQLRVPDLSSPDQMARFVCALYGVAYDKSETKTEAFLVYDPKAAKPEEIRDWEEGRPVTTEEKARAAAQ